jgi:hypothetical protein
MRGILNPPKHVCERVYTCTLLEEVSHLSPTSLSRRNQDAFRGTNRQASCSTASRGHFARDIHTPGEISTFSSKQRLTTLTDNNYHVKNCHLDRRTLSICISMIENGVNPEALAVSLHPSQSLQRRRNPLTHMSTDCCERTS